MEASQHGLSTIFALTVSLAQNHFLAQLLGDSEMSATNVAGASLAEGAISATNKADEACLVVHDTPPSPPSVL